MWEALLDDKLRSLTPDQCQEMVSAGDWVLVDVRPADDFAKASPEGAFNVPLFQQVNFSQATPKSLLRAAAYMFNGVKPVEPNPTFLEDLETVADGKGVIMMCETAGTLKPSTNFMTGKTSRSLKAAYIASKAKGIRDVAHLEGGVYGWYLANAPMRGNYDTDNVGRTPNSAAETVIKETEGK